MPIAGYSASGAFRLAALDFAVNRQAGQMVSVESDKGVYVITILHSSDHDVLSI